MSHLGSVLNKPVSLKGFTGDSFAVEGHWGLVAKLQAAGQSLKFFGIFNQFLRHSNQILIVFEAISKKQQIAKNLNSVEELKLLSLFTQPFLTYRSSPKHF